VSPAGRSVTVAAVTDRLANSSYLRACRGEPGDRVPVWFQRQAGRSLPEYREIRGTGTILDAIAQPDLATEITLQPVRRYGVDAAILYSDIVVPVHAIGFGVTIEPGVGPVIAEPFRTEADLSRFRPLDPEADTSYVLETVRNLLHELDVPLIGFAGGPFTVASYLVEGGPSRNYTVTKTMMRAAPMLFHRLLDTLADLAIASLRSQVDNGASAIQIFDSWAGALHPDDYRRFVQPHTRKVMDAVADLDVPRAHFGVTTGELLPAIAETGADVIGVDWRVPIDEARARIPRPVTLQGNLDPAICLAPVEAVEDEVRAILARNADHPAYVFNLGHGVLPETDPDVLARVVEIVHDEGRADADAASAALAGAGDGAT
jgi:uroporphyrinogen decarboxylase